MVIKVVLHAFDDLVVLVSFARYENHIAWSRQYASRLDSRLAVLNDECMAQLLLGESSRHVLQYSMWLLIARVVGGQYQLCTQLVCALGHHGTFAFVAIATATDHGYYLRWGGLLAGVGCYNLVDGLQHVLHRVRGVGVVNDGCPALG